MRSLLVVNQHRLSISLVGHRPDRAPASRVVFPPVASARKYVFARRRPSLPCWPRTSSRTFRERQHPPAISPPHDPPLWILSDQRGSATRYTSLGDRSAIARPMLACSLSIPEPDRAWG